LIGVLAAIGAAPVIAQVHSFSLKGYEDRPQYREVIGTKYARELVLR
jgi:hypothetical protein